MRRRSCFILLAVIVLLLVAGINGVKADQHLSDYQLRKDIESTLSAFVFDAQWAKTVPDTVIAIYHAAPGFGVAILKYDSSTGFSVLEKNDHMIPSKGSSATARLDDHTPEYSIEIGWEDPKENDYLTLQADDQENWKIINLEYTISDGQDDKMVFCRLSDDGKTAIIVGPDWIGMYGSEMNSQFFGSHAWGDITIIDWSSLPPEEFGSQETKEMLSAMVDRTDWAVTAQNDPDGTTKLLAEAGSEEPSLGDFYNGTPLFVLEHGSEWTKVRIGSDESTGAMIGWMRTEDLTFGDEMLQVNREAIQIHSEKELIHSVEPFIGSETGMITAAQFSECLVIGESESDQRYAIVYYLKNGSVGLVPITSLGNGNG